jgi:hypothetical protein
VWECGNVGDGWEMVDRVRESAGVAVAVAE